VANQYVFLPSRRRKPESAWKYLYQNAPAGGVPALRREVHNYTWSGKTHLSPVTVGRVPVLARVVANKIPTRWFRTLQGDIPPPARGLGATEANTSRPGAPARQEDKE